MHSFCCAFFVLSGDLNSKGAFCVKKTAWMAVFSKKVRASPDASRVDAKHEVFRRLISPPAPTKNAQLHAVRFLLCVEI